MRIEAEAPGSGRALREAIYGGRIFRLGACGASEAIVARAWAHLEEAFADLGPPRIAQFSVGVPAYLDRLAGARRALARDRAVAEACAALLDHHGLDPGAHLADTPRLRAILSGGHGHPDAGPVYVAHRDTWYANPRAQLNWWIPLHDVTPEEAFDLYPTALGTPTPNDSGSFHYARFVERAGWQATRPTPGITYPGATGSVAALGHPPESAAAQRAEVVVFAGAHLHQTRAHDAGRTRFSVDLRTVHLGDHAAGRGAPDPDNACTGRAIDDYRPMVDP